MQQLMQALVLGTSNVAIYLLLGVSVTLIYGVLHVLNFAQGDFMSVAAYTGFAAVTGVGTGLLFSSGFVIPVLVVLGVLFYFLMIRPMSGHQPEMVIVATFGLALLIQGGLRVIWGGSPRGIPRNLEAWRIGGVTITEVTVINLVMASVGLMALWLLLTRSALGREMRALAQDRTGAAVSGINIWRVELAVIVIALLLSGLAGYLILQQEVLLPEVGANLTLKAFAVAIVAGLGRVNGLLWAAIALGLMEALISSFVSASVATAGVFAVVIIILIWRPHGLVGVRARV